MSWCFSSTSRDQVISKIGSLHPHRHQTSPHTGICASWPRCLPPTQDPPVRPPPGFKHYTTSITHYTEKGPPRSLSTALGAAVNTPGEDSQDPRVRGLAARVCVSSHFFIPTLITLSAKSLRCFLKRSACSPVFFLATSSLEPDTHLLRSHRPQPCGPRPAETPWL